MLIVFLKGMIIGIANVIPGVSGGTASVLLGVYSQLTESIANFFKVNKKKKIEYTKFLSVIGFGILCGIVLFAKLIKFFIVEYPILTTSFFTILILLSLPAIIKGFNFKKTENIYFFILGIAVMTIVILLNYIYRGANNFTLRESFDFYYCLKIFLCGAISSFAMVIPGISGSLLLLIIGEYYNILSYVSNFTVKPLFFLLIGILLGVLISTKTINYLLENYKEKTMFFIFGIILTSIFQIWMNIV